MLYHRFSLSVFLFILSAVPHFSQEGNGAIQLNGYLSNMQSTMIPYWKGSWITDNMIHNRLNLKWYISGSFRTNIEIRNRLIYGESMKTIPYYAKLINNEQGWLDLSANIFQGKSYLFHSTIDRLWIDFSKGNLQIRVGRQRINWGQNMMWNPNDIFNAYSFFDFDYVEKPGSDALRIQYYTGVSSVAEAAVKVDHNNDITAAGFFRFSKWNYDIQLLGGILNSEDYVAGIGWSGDIKGAGFRGEATYFHPIEQFSDSSGFVIFGLSADYTFKNSLYLLVEFLYNGYDLSILNFSEFYFMPLSVKTISFTDYSIGMQISYPFTPLLNGNLALIYFPSLDAVFSGPTLDLSLKDNLSLSLIAQYFNGKFADQKEDLGFGFIRLKWNF
jgi:hypothetical protein